MKKIPVPPRLKKLELELAALKKTVAALAHEVEDVENAVHIKHHPITGIDG